MAFRQVLNRIMNKSAEESVADADVTDSGDRSVKPFELFFDLVFVYAFTQVTQLLTDEPSWGRLGQGVLLLAALWLVWQFYAWLYTTIDIDEGALRLAVLAVMGGVLTAALAVPSAFGDSAVLFAVAYAFVRLMGLVLFGIAARNIDDLLPAILRVAPSSTVAQVAFRMRCGGSLAKPRVVAVFVLVVLIGVSGLINALALISAVSLSFVLLVAYEAVAERESRQLIRSDAEASWK